MAIAFPSPSQRAAGGDLTIAVSPLGLVELADEEFEVHGPRLNRYAQAWAYYLGHHWAYVKQAGEPQLTVQLHPRVIRLAGQLRLRQGRHFAVDAEFQHITSRPARPDLGRRTTTRSRRCGPSATAGRSRVTLHQGRVRARHGPTRVGMPHPGRVRILPINPASASRSGTRTIEERLDPVQAEVPVLGDQPGGHAAGLHVRRDHHRRLDRRVRQRPAHRPAAEPAGLDPGRAHR